MNLRWVSLLFRVGVLVAGLSWCGSPALQAADCRVLVLGPSDKFPAADIAVQLEALLVGSGLFGEADVVYRDITRDASLATSLLGVAYVPPYRTDHLSAIQQGGWTHVVMIDRPYFYALAPELHYVGVNALAKIISSAGAQPVLMMPWIDRSAIEGENASQTLVREYAYRVGDGVRDSLGRSVPVVPAGVAWSTLDVASRGTLPAQPADGVALNTNGKYAAAAALFHFLTGTNARTVSYLPAGLTAGVRDAIADHVTAVAASEATAVRYTGEFQSTRVRFWSEQPTLPYTYLGLSTEDGIRDQLVKISSDDGKPPIDTKGSVVKGLASGKTAAQLVFGREGNIGAVSTYDNGNPVTTMVSAFDRQEDNVSNGPAGAVNAELRSVSLYKTAAFYGWNYLPYHLLWVRTMYDLNIPIDPFSVHAPDWQFAATASAMYTQRMNGRNGIHPATVGYVYWSPALRTERFVWQTGKMAWETMHEMASLKPAPAAPDRPYGLNRVIDAEYPFATSRAMPRAAHALETFQINGLVDGDWTSYKVDFGNPGPLVVGCLAQVATSVAGAEMEVRDGSPGGTLLGTVPLPHTGGVQSFLEARGLLAAGGMTGIRQLYFVFRVPVGGEVRIDAFRLSVQARASEAVWISPSGGDWSASALWREETPQGEGWTARFSLDIPGGLGNATLVSVSGTKVLSKLELGHGVGTSGGVRLQDAGNGTLEFRSTGGPALIRKKAGGEDVIAVPLKALAPLQIRNETGPLLSLTQAVTGQNDLLPCGNVNFSGSGYDLGRLGFGTGLTYPGNVSTTGLGGNFVWTAEGTVRNFYIPQYTTWNLNAGTMTNQGWTEIGNDDEATSGGDVVLNINGGTFRHASTQYLRLGQYHKATTLIHLNGGTFETQSAFTKGAGAVTFNFNGGLMRYSGSTDVADLFAAAGQSAVVTQVGTGGVHVAVESGRSVTLQNNLVRSGSVDGGLRKSGAGTWVLSGSQTLTGPVVVEAGVLRATGANSLGNPNRFTVLQGATLSIPGPGGIGVYGMDAGWTGGGTLEGGIYVAGAPVVLGDESLTVTDDAVLGDVRVSFVPQAGTTLIQSGGELSLYGSLTLEVQAPSQAIAAGTTLTLARGASRDGEFSSVSGSNLWSVGYSGGSVVLTALANMPGVVLDPPNHGTPAVWGQNLVLSATVGDVAGISKVEFYANGRLIGQGVEGSAGVFTFAWNLGLEEAQTYLITTRVTNTQGVTLESPGQQLVVNGLAGPESTWTNPAGGVWSSTGNWMAGQVADHYGTALFDTVDLPTGTSTVEVDAPRTLAKLRFGDTSTATVGVWKLVGSGANKIHLSGGAADVSVASGTSAEWAAPLEATKGFSKSGAGSLILSTANNDLAGSVKLAAGTLAATDSGALGSATLLLGGGGLNLPSGVTLTNPIRLDTTTPATVTCSAAIQFSGGWSHSDSANGGKLLLWSTASAANVTHSGSIYLPGADLEVAGLSNTVTFSGNVTVRNFRFYGRTGTPQGDLHVVFSGNATASCSQSLTTINDGRTTNIRINDQAQLTLPGFTTSGRANFYLNGGVLTARRIPMGAFSAFYANGGVLRPMASDPAFMYGTSSVRPFQVQTGGLKVDTRGFDIGMTASIVTNTNPDGGVTKMGAGTMTVDGSSINMTWRGPTRVLAGTLRLGAASGLSTNSRVFEITQGATLDIASSTTPTLSLANSNNALSGAGTLKGGLSISTGAVSLTAGQPLQVTGNATLSGGSLTVGGTLTGPGDHAVLTANQVTGMFASVGTLPAAPAGFTRQLVYESNRVVVRVNGPGEVWLAANAAPGARFSDDPDGNGWTLLQEYALGAQPGEHIGGRFTARPSDEGRPRMGLAYNTAAVDVLIEVQMSHDLSTWTTLVSKPAGSGTAWTQHVAGAEIEGGVESGGVQQVVVTAPATTQTKAFFRVRVLRAG